MTMGVSRCRVGADPASAIDAEALFCGRWRSQNGSEMTLSVALDGQIAGVYRSALGAVEPAEQFPLTGWVNGDLLSFTVNFGSRGLAAWVGQHTWSEGEERITTLWQLAEDIEEELESRWLWYGFKSGADVFARIASDPGPLP